MAPTALVNSSAPGMLRPVMPRYFAGPTRTSAGMRPATYSFLCFAYRSIFVDAFPFDFVFEIVFDFELVPFVGIASPPLATHRIQTGVQFRVSTPESVHS